VGRYYVRSLRVAAWVTIGLLAVMAGFYYLDAPPDRISLAYHRVWQFYKLAAGFALCLPLVQGLRAAAAPLIDRLQPPSTRAPVDGWAAQVWGPLMIENLIYGAWLLVACAFLWRYQVRIPAPQPWQGSHPPYAGLTLSDWQWLGQLYGSALVMTVAGAYANLLGAGAAVVPLWGLFCVILPAPFAALALLVALRLLALRPVPEPKKPKPDRFGLVQLLAVVGMVLMLGSILVPNFMRAKARGNLTACKSNLKNIGTALEMYSTDHGGLYPTSPDLLTPRYLKTIPTCPTMGWVTYQFQMASKPDLYTVVCAGRHHTGAGVQEYNYPQYTSTTGLIERP